MILFTDSWLNRNSLNGSGSLSRNLKMASRLKFCPHSWPQVSILSLFTSFWLELPNLVASMSSQTLTLKGLSKVKKERTSSKNWCIKKRLTAHLTSRRFKKRSELPWSNRKPKTKESTAKRWTSSNTFERCSSIKSRLEMPKNGTSLSMTSSSLAQSKSLIAAITPTWTTSKNHKPATNGVFLWVDESPSATRWRTTLRRPL